MLVIIQGRDVGDDHHHRPRDAPRTHHIVLSDPCWTRQTRTWMRRKVQIGEQAMSFEFFRVEDNIKLLP